jgi:hypothetical protein
MTFRPIPIVLRFLHTVDHRESLLVLGWDSALTDDALKAFYITQFSATKPKSTTIPPSSYGPYPTSPPNYSLLRSDTFICIIAEPS